MEIVLRSFLMKGFFLSASFLWLHFIFVGKRQKRTVLLIETRQTRSDNYSMDPKMPKLPAYVFRRQNGSYRYKRNVPKKLRHLIGKDTLYRQLGESYSEAMYALPKYTWK
jgi:hypothetical protein